jgi:hypothetical protein
LIADARTVIRAARLQHRAAEGLRDDRRRYTFAALNRVESVGIDAVSILGYTARRYGRDTDSTVGPAVTQSKRCDIALMARRAV